MPTAVAASSSPSTHLSSKPLTGQTTRNHTQAPRIRVVRRRGRGRRSIGSDDEIEREAQSDPESEEEDSSDGSSSDSDTEPASEDVVINGNARILTPSTSKTPDEEPARPSTKQNGTSQFFSSTSWSEMVAEDAANGPSELPVIDFADLSATSLPSSAPHPKQAPHILKRSKQASEPASLPSPPLSTKGEPEKEEQTDTRPSQPPRRPFRQPSYPNRPAGQSARQAYQNRLENDPSYVPTVGEFWGHDDRLLDKNLRSLSGWWRGRWQGRGRGRGTFDRGFMRGRGGFAGRPGFKHVADAEQPPVAEVPVPPSERPWTHDGFEEMKRVEHRKANPQPTFRGRGGRGGVPPVRGRGSFPRYGVSPSPSRTASTSAAADRIWYKMKPPLMWTKQHDAFLYLDPALKPRFGEGPSYRVRLPGKGARLVKGPVNSKLQPPPPMADTTVAFTSPIAETDGMPCVVRLPQPKKQVQEPVKEDPVTVDETSIEEVFTVRPHLVTANPIPLPQPSNVRSGSISISTSIPVRPPTATHLPDPAMEQQLSQLSIGPKDSDPVRWTIEGAVMRNPSTTTEQQQPSTEPAAVAQSPTQNQPPPSQPTYMPPVYGFAPTGMVMNGMGMPYDMATGRPVYMPAMYNVANSRPMLPSGMPYIPEHVRQQSGGYMHQPHPSLSAPIDPITGAPVFSLPRPSPVAIRAPGDDNSKTATPSHQRTMSTLRPSAPAFQPPASQPEQNAGTQSPPAQPYYAPNADHNASYAPQEDEQQNADTPPQTVPGIPQIDPNMLMYNMYQQYYYPTDAYGYPQYVDMSQIGQYGEMYPVEGQSPAGPVYY